MTFQDLEQETMLTVFPDGQPENLVSIHQAFLIQSLYDIQKSVPCLKYNHRDRFKHCATYFNCGMTVLPKPQGKITEVFITDTLNEDGDEDIDGEEEYCSKVYLQWVEHCHMRRFAKMCQRSTSADSTIAEAFSNLIFGTCRSKSRYPRPTDEGMEGLPPLPEGFHYPQSSTDASGRACRGVFSFDSGQLWIAPWIQSTEIVTVRWNGIKRTWNPDDLVENDPKFKQAVLLHFAHQHHSFYGDPAKATDYHDQLWGNPNRGMAGAIPTLIHECKEEMTAARCGDSSSMTGAARGLGKQSTLYYNSQRFSYTAQCPTGKTGTAVTVVKEVGSVGSAKSVADANALASQAAADEATARLVCTDVVVTYYSAPAIGHASCPGPQSDGTPAADGNAVSVPVPAGYRTSNVDQQTADEAAQEAADALAEESLVCTFWNKAQEQTVSCPTGETGDPVTKSVAAHTFSAPSQSLANQLAIDEARRLAKLELVCNGSTPTVFYNTPQTVGPLLKICHGVSRTAPVGGGGCTFTISATINVGAGRVTGISQVEANNNAIAYAQEYFNARTLQPGFCGQYPQCVDASVTWNI